MIVGADIRVSAVLHAESLGDSSELYEAELLVEVTRVDIRLHHSVELQYAEALMLSLFEAVLDELLANVMSAAVLADGIAGVADVSAPTDIIGVEDIQPYHVAVVVLRDGAVGLRGKEALARVRVEYLLLREGDALLDDVVPDVYHLRKVLVFVLNDRNAHYLTSFIISP